MIYYLIFLVDYRKRSCNPFNFWLISLPYERRARLRLCLAWGFWKVKFFKGIDLLSFQTNLIQIFKGCYLTWSWWPKLWLSLQALSMTMVTRLIFFITIGSLSNFSKPFSFPKFTKSVLDLWIIFTRVQRRLYI